MLKKQIEEISTGIWELKANRAERFTVKQMERAKRSLEGRLEKLQAEHKKDDVVTFEELGIDRLFVDEAHSYKNLFLYTKMQNVAGLSTSDAQKSSDMFAKCRYMDELTGGRGVIFATGTPVSNSMTELYTMQRYLQYAICEVLLDHKIECNFVLAGFENGVTKLICTGKDYNYKFQVEDVKNGTVRALLPPDLTIENCIRFFPSTFNLRSQTVSCIKTLSQNSKSVNDKICGFEVTTNGLRCFTDGISYEDISYRLTKE